MWSDRKPWWVKKAKDLQADKTHYKNWCVIKVVVGYGDIRTTLNGLEADAIFKYRAVGRMNAPQYYDDETGKLKKSIEVDNLTKHEAICVAKGLNFLDGETNGS
jgi:hypothetical protein